MATPSNLITEYEYLNERLIELGRRWECEVDNCNGLPHEGYIHNHARASQREPISQYRTWVLVTGRGFGKTRTGAETVRKWVNEGARHIAIIAKTDREVRNICFDGPAGIVRLFRPEEIKGYNASAGSTKLTLKNGTIIRAFSSENPDTLRGYAFDGAWCDEYAAWSQNTAQNAMDMLWFCLRESANPRVIVTTTPKPLQHVKKLIKRAADDSSVILTRGTTKDNSANLSEDALMELHVSYGGTRLGRQELEGELLEDVEGALWKLSEIEEARVTEAPQLIRVVVGVDPAVTNNENSDQTGIVTVGVASNGHFYVLSDKSLKASPDTWARVAVQAYHDFKADKIIAEANNGGDMIAILMRAVDTNVPVKKVTATRGKQLRAEPISALYEQGRVHHVGVFAELETQMCEWTPLNTSYSPDRLDALVWALTELSTGGSSMIALASMSILCSACGMPSPKSSTVCYSCGVKLGGNE